jgi:TPP-dependent pyruvate/acetoin dehydrogenase alpha subunit
VFAESLNLARLKEVPVLFICENNQLAIHSRIEARQAAGQIWERARVVGIESMRIERSDTIRLFHAARDAIASMRSGGGPSFIEAVTYRWKEHVGPGDDWSLGYRSADEAEPWMADDQMVRVGDLLGADLRERIDREVEATIVDAIAFAEASPFPGPGELYADLYREEVAWSAR